MNREIKFRAWDKLNEKMVTVWDISFKAWNDSEINCITVEYDNGTYELGYVDFELMQFTNLHDKNGKEIYEGDVVQHDAWDYPFEIIFNQENARFVCKMKSGLTQFIDNNGLEVIGNIYETPELIKIS